MCELHTGAPTSQTPQPRTSPPRSPLRSLPAQPSSLTSDLVQPVLCAIFCELTSEFQVKKKKKDKKGREILKRISKRRRIYSKLKFSGRTDYFYQSCKENCSLLSSPAPVPAQKPNVNVLLPTSALARATAPADSVLVFVVDNCTYVMMNLLSSLRAKSPSPRIFIFYQYMPVNKRRKYELFKFNFFM